MKLRDKFDKFSKENSKYLPLGYQFVNVYKVHKEQKTFAESKKHSTLFYSVGKELLYKPTSYFFNQ